MSENIEKAVPTEESPKTKESETSAPAATDNVVLYPVADISAAQETTDTETAASKEITDPQNTDNQTTIDSKTTDGKASDNADKFSDTRNTKEFSKKDAEEDEDLEEDFYEQQEKSRSKDEHPFREFFSNFRSKRKIEMNRDEQILSRISDEDLMEYLRMEQKRMELLQQAKEVREKRFWTTFQLFICLLSVILVIYFLKDNPVILVSILYTVGILTALRIWSKSQNRKDHRDKKDSSDYHKKPWELLHFPVTFYHITRSCHHTRQHYAGSHTSQSCKQRTRQCIAHLRDSGCHIIYTHGIKDRLRTRHTDRCNPSDIRICSIFFKNVQQKSRRRR